MTKSDPDLQLVQRVQEGDLSAFDLLFERYKHRLQSVAYRYLDSQEEAEEVVQDTFVKVYQSINSFRGTSKFYTWLYRIATNTAKTYLVRKERKLMDQVIRLDDEQIFVESTALIETDTPENIYEEQELELILNAAIQELEPDLRDTLTLREYAALNYEQIAEILDSPVGTVRSRLFRAREFLSETIDTWISGTG